MRLFLALDSSMLSAYFDVKSTVSNTGFAKAQKKKSAPRRKPGASVVEAAEPDETTAVRHARVRDGDDDLRGLLAAQESSLTSAASSSLIRGGAQADDIITEDKWEYLWNDKAGDDGDDLDNDDDGDGDREAEEEDEAVDSLTALPPEGADSDYGASMDQPCHMDASPLMFRKSLERKLSCAGIVEYEGPRLTLEDDDF